MSVRLVFGRKPKGLMVYPGVSINTGFGVRYRVGPGFGDVGPGNSPDYRPGKRGYSLKNGVLYTWRSPLQCREVLVKEHIAMRAHVERDASYGGRELVVVDPTLTGGLHFSCFPTSRGSVRSLKKDRGIAVLHLAVGIPFLHMSRNDRSALRLLKSFSERSGGPLQKYNSGHLQIYYNGILSSRVMASAEFSCSLLAALGRTALQNYAWMSTKDRSIVDAWAEEATSIVYSGDAKKAEKLLDKSLSFLFGASCWKSDELSFLAFQPFGKAAVGIKWAYSMIQAPITRSTSLVQLRSTPPAKKSKSTGLMSLRAMKVLERRSALNRAFLMKNAPDIEVEVSTKR